MDKYTNKPLPMEPLPFRSSSCKDTEKSLFSPTFPKRSTSIPPLPSVAAPVSEGLEILPAKAYVPALINKRLPPLPASAYAPSSPTEKVEILPATVYVPPSTHKDLPILPVTNYSRKLSNASRISNDSSNFSLADLKSVTLDTPLRTSYLLSPPSHPSPPLRKKACRSPLLPPDGVEVESLVLVTVQGPTPSTTPATIATATSTPTSIKAVRRLDVKKRRRSKLSATRSRNRQSMLLSSIAVTSAAPPTPSSHRKSFYRGPKKVKRDSMAIHRRRRFEIPSVDSTESIFHMIDRPEQPATPPSVPQRTFEQLYLQILEERWAYYRQLDAMREADEKREIEEYLDAHPVAPSVPSPLPQRTALQGARQARHARKLPVIPEKNELRAIVAKTTTITQTREEKRLTVSSPHLFPIPPSPRKRMQKLKGGWREWLKSGKKQEGGGGKRKLTKKTENASKEDELRAIGAYSDAGLRVAFGYRDDWEQHKETKNGKKRRCWISRFFEMI